MSGEGPNLYEFLRHNSGVAAFVGDRIYPEMIPQASQHEARKLPCIVYTTTAESRSATYCGTDRLVSAAIQVDLYTPGYDQTLQLRAAVRLALRDFRGMMGDTLVRLTRLDSSGGLVEPEPGLFRRSQDWTFWYVEP